MNQHQRGDLKCKNVTKVLALFAALTFMVSSPSTATPMDKPAGENLKIVVIEGEDGVNTLKEKIIVKPVVEVRDGWNLPIAGAAVTFTLPSGKPGATFKNNQKDMSVTTDANGRATTSEVKLVGKGSFKIGVRASYKGDVASASITQTNFSTAADARKAVKIPGSYTNALTGTTKRF